MTENKNRLEKLETDVAYLLSVVKDAEALFAHAKEVVKRFTVAAKELGESVKMPKEPVTSFRCPRIEIPEHMRPALPSVTTKFLDGTFSWEHLLQRAVERDQCSQECIDNARIVAEPKTDAPIPEPEESTQQSEPLTLDRAWSIFKSTNPEIKNDGEQ